MSRIQDEISAKSAGSVTLGGFTFDLGAHELRDASGARVALRKQSADVLAELARAPDTTVEKSALVDRVWRGTAVTDDSLVQCIADIRRVLGPGGRDCIQTVPRKGYRLVPGAAPRPLARARWQVSGVALALVVAAAAWVLLSRPADDAAPPPIPSASVLFRPTIAVLPFDNMSGDPERRYFSDGLTEDLTTDLSRLSGLSVISSVSSFAHRDSDLPVGAIAADLGATHLVRGSIRQDGDRVRINATLTDAESGANLWADRFDRELTDVFALQDDVTRAIVAALSVKLTDREQAQLDRHRQIDPDAYDLLLRSLPPLRRITRDGNAEAHRLLSRVIEIDPGYARAHANLALLHGQATVFRLGGEPDANIATGLRAAKLAEALDDTVPQTQFARAVLHLAARDHTAAIAASRRAIELDPSYADGYAVLAQTTAHAGDPAAALPAIQRAKALNPRYTFAYLWVEGHILFQLRRYEEARALLEDVVARNPSFYVGLVTLIATYGHLGLTDEASWPIVELLTIEPEFSARAEADAVPYHEASDRAHLVEGLLLAGLPE